MNFLESFDKITNRIRSFSKADKGFFWLDITNGVAHEWFVLWQLKTLFDKQKSDEYAIQCKCGRLDVINEEIFNRCHKNKITSDSPSLQCSRCLKLSLRFSTPMENFSPVVTKGLSELNKVFKKAQTDNYMTLCYFLWRAIGIENEQLNEIANSVAIIFDQYMKNNLEIFLMNEGLSMFRMSNEYHFSRQYMLSLLALNHIIEIEGLYDLIVSIAAIAECEQYLVGDDGRSIQPVGLRFVKPEGENKRDTVKFKISSLIKWLRKRKLMSLAKLIQIAFNHELRNAFAHSEYNLTKTGVYLTRFKREVSYGKLQESFLGAYYLLSALTDTIKSLRGEFIASGGYTEGGWKLEPIVSDGGMAVRITTSSPGGGPTGKRKPQQLLDACNTARIPLM